MATIVTAGREKDVGGCRATTPAAAMVTIGRRRGQVLRTTACSEAAAKTPAASAEPRERKMSLDGS